MRIIIGTSLFYIWITPFCLAYAIMLIVDDVIKGTLYKPNFLFLGIVLASIIIPIYCLLWYAANY